MNRAFLAGLLAGVAFLGCLAAVTNTNGSTGARYEVHWSPTVSSYVVLDTQTGATVAWEFRPFGEFREFRPE